MWPFATAWTSAARAGSPFLGNFVGGAIRTGDTKYEVET
jgi:hypothetical protein